MVGYGGRLVLCSACAVHIKRSEVVCPHCGARRPPRASFVAPVAIGLALTGCPSDEAESGGSDGAEDFGEAAYGTPDTGFSDIGDDPDDGADGSTSADADGSSSGTVGDSSGGSGSGSSSGSGSDSSSGSGSDSGSDSGTTGTGGSGSGSSGGR